MSERVWRTALLGLLTGVLISQWIVEWQRNRQAEQSLATMRSIESLLRQHNESNEQVIASLEEIADAVADVHSHVEGFGTEKDQERE